MTKTWDLLVLGGGPAGGATAAIAAREGARVLLLERDRFPRDKVCGEFVSAEGCAVLSRLGVLDALRERGAVSISRCVVTVRGGRKLESPLPDLPGIGRDAVGITRAALDEALLSLAADRGAVVRQRVEAVAPIVEDGILRGVLAREVGAAPGREEALRARVVVAADGRRSMLQRALAPDVGDPLRSGPRSWFGMKRHFEGDVSRLADTIELHLFDGGYVGISAVEGNRANLCLLTTVGALRACGGSGDRLLAGRVLRNPAAAASIESLRPAGDWLSVGPLRFGARRPVLAGAILVGDAAGTVDPFAGEGIANALLAAEIATRHAVEAAERGWLDAGLARAYEREWRSALGAGIARARWLGRLFERPALAGLAARVLAAPGGARLFARLVAASRTGG